ncbi:SufE family protein [Salana multivorans]
MTTPALPPALAEIRESFLELSVPDRLQLLLEFANGLPSMPERFAQRPELLEPVPECQSPIAFVTEIVRAREDGTAPDDDADEPAARVHFYASAPAGAPTSRGFAGILAEGLDGLTPQEVIAVPGDYPLTLGLAEAVSPLRLRGMTALLARAKRQVSERMAG